MEEIFLWVKLQKNYKMHKKICLYVFFGVMILTNV